MLIKKEKLFMMLLVSMTACLESTTRIATPVDEIQTSQNRTNLIQASSEGRLDVVKTLIASKVDVNQRGPAGNTALMAASRTGHLSVVRTLLVAGANVEADVYGSTALIQAAENGHREVVQELISGGANVDSLTYTGISPLIAATSSGHFDIVTILIRHDADLDGRGGRVADFGGDTIRKGIGNTALMSAVTAGRLDILRALIDAGADLNIQNSYGVTALIIASRKGEVELANALVTAGADTTIQEHSGDTALEVALEKKHLEIAALLESKNAGDRKENESAVTVAENIRVVSIEAVGNMLVVTVGITDFQKPFNIDSTTTLSIRVEGKEKDISAEGVLIPTAGFSKEITALADPRQSRIIITDSVQTLGFVPMDTTYQDLKSIRIVDEELLIPVLFKSDPQLHKVRLLVFGNSNIQMEEGPRVVTPDADQNISASESEVPSSVSNANKVLDDLFKNSNNKKLSLTRRDVQRGMAAVAPAVKRCGQGKGGTITMSVNIAKTGRVSDASATGAFAGTPIGSCAARAIRRAKFPSSRQRLNVRYPFKL